MNKRELRGSTASPNYDRLPANWETLDHTGKIQRSIMMMSNPSFVAKRGRVSGEDTFLMRIEHEPGLALEISSALGGREAVIFFIENLYRSENGGHSSQSAMRARKLFALEETREEQAKIRDAELDCRAFAIDFQSGDKEEWLKDLTDTEAAEVEHRAQHYAK